ncbi:MAG: BREX system ATP-binding domain-containing protein [Smithellaceae bacterium]|nr:BREX system ATP-binding domain-containing protein [Smithellaceae bacterium]
MYIKYNEWLDTLHGEYLSDFIKQGGAAVKFAVPMEDIDNNEILNLLCKSSEKENYLFTSVHAVSTKIHMIDKLFHEVARQIDWDELSSAFVKNIFIRNGYELPKQNEDFNLQHIAAINNREEKFLRRELRSWLEKDIFHDFQMSQEFRIAMIRLCIDQLDTAGPSSFLSNAVKEWLRGELRLISTLKEALIFQKITRHNARHMLFSLSHWLRINGKSGLIVVLDITRYLISTRSKNPDDGFFYSVPALLDAYEVLRQFIDGTDEMEGCLIVVLASKGFLDPDDRRGLGRYDALKLRIWDEVRDRQRQNPLASLVRLANRNRASIHQVSGEVQ